MFIYLYIASGCFHTARTELSSYNRDYGPEKPKMFIWPFVEKKKKHKKLMTLFFMALCLFNDIKEYRFPYSRFLSSSAWGSYSPFASHEVSRGSFLCRYSHNNNFSGSTTLKFYRFKNSKLHHSWEKFRAYSNLVKREELKRFLSLQAF